MSYLRPAKSAKVLPGETRTEAERATAICVRLTTGQHSLRAAAKLEGLDHSRFLSMVRLDPELEATYIEAKEAGVESRVSELSAQADEVMSFAKNVGSHANAYVTAFARKAAIEMWLAEKQSNKKYGAKIDHNVAGSVEFTEVRRTIVDPQKPDPVA